MTGASVLGIVVGKLRHGKKPCQIILLEVDKNLEVGFHYTILPLGLPVCLGIESGKEFLLNA